MNTLGTDAKKIERLKKLDKEKPRVRKSRKRKPTIRDARTGKVVEDPRTIPEREKAFGPDVTGEIPPTRRRGPEADAAERFADSLRKATALEVDLIDERWSTIEAERALREMGQTGKRGRKRKLHVDAVAASILLRSYLASGAHLA